MKKATNLKDLWQYCDPYEAVPVDGEESEWFVDCSRVRKSAVQYTDIFWLFAKEVEEHFRTIVKRELDPDLLKRFRIGSLLSSRQKPGKLKQVINSRQNLVLEGMCLFLQN